MGDSNGKKGASGKKRAASRAKERKGVSSKKQEGAAPKNQEEAPPKKEVLSEEEMAAWGREGGTGYDDGTYNPPDEDLEAYASYPETMVFPEAMVDAVADPFANTGHEPKPEEPKPEEPKPEEPKPEEVAEAVEKAMPFIRVTTRALDRAQFDEENAGLPDAVWQVEAVSPDGKNILHTETLTGHPLVNYLKLRDQIIPALKKTGTVGDAPEIKGVVERLSENLNPHNLEQRHADTLKAFNDAMTEVMSDVYPTKFDGKVDEAERKRVGGLRSAFQKSLREDLTKQREALRGKARLKMMNEEFPGLVAELKKGGMGAEEAAREAERQIDARAQGIHLPNVLRSIMGHLDRDLSSAGVAIGKGGTKGIAAALNEVLGIDKAHAKGIAESMNAIRKLEQSEFDNMVDAIARDRFRSDQFTGALNDGDFSALYNHLLPLSKKMKPYVPLIEKGQIVMRPGYSNYFKDVGVSPEYRQVNPSVDIPHLNLNSDITKVLLKVAKGDPDAFGNLVSTAYSDLFNKDNWLKVKVGDKEFYLPGLDLMKDYKDSVGNSVANLWARFTKNIAAPKQANAKGKTSGNLPSDTHGNAFQINPVLGNFWELAQEDPEVAKMLADALDTYGEEPFVPDEEQAKRIEKAREKFISDRVAGPSPLDWDGMSALLGTVLGGIKGKFHDTREKYLSEYGDDYGTVDENGKFRLSDKMEGFFGDGKLLGSKNNYRNNAKLKDYVMRVMWRMMLDNPLDDVGGRFPFDIYALSDKFSHLVNMPEEQKEQLLSNVFRLQDEVVKSLINRSKESKPKAEEPKAEEPKAEEPKAEEPKVERKTEDDTNSDARIKDFKPSVDPNILSAVYDSRVSGDVMSDYNVKEPVGYEQHEARRRQLLGWE